LCRTVIAYVNVHEAPAVFRERFRTHAASLTQAKAVMAAAAAQPVHTVTGLIYPR